MRAPLSRAAKASTHLAASASLLVMSNILATGLAAQTSEPGSAVASAPPAEEIVVSGVRGSLQKSLDQERRAVSVVSVITADDIGQFADQNVAESLQRLAGVTIGRFQGEGRNIRVRGLSDDFNQVSLNGAQVGSSNSDGGRSVALDVISSELLSSVRVAKALTPNMDHDSLGALVELRTLSAFDRPTSSMRLRAEGSYNQNGDAWSPKIAGDATFRSSDDRFGVAFAFNYFDREVQNDQLRNDVQPPFANVFLRPGNVFQINPATPPADGERFLRPEEADQRVQIGFRERMGATLTLDYRPSDDHKFFVSAVGARLVDEDIRVQQEIEFRRASRVQDQLAIGPRTGSNRRTDFDKQIFFQNSTDRVLAFNAGGENRFGDWKIAYRADYSHSLFTLPNGVRSRYRRRDIGASYVAGIDSVDIELSPVGSNDPFNPSQFVFDALLRVDERRTDEILTFGIDLSRDFSLFGREATVTVGVKNRNREKVIRRGEISVNPNDAEFRTQLDAAGIASNMGQLERFTPRTRLSSFGEFPLIDVARREAYAAVDVLGLTTENAGRVDFDSSEDVLAGFAMLEATLAEGLSMVAGVRVERTNSGNAGTLTTRERLDGVLVVNASEPISGVGTSYTRALPSMHLRYEPNPDIVMRLVLARNQVRPTFGDLRALQEVFVDRETIDGQVTTFARTLDGGNPQLSPLIADGVDATFGYYGFKDTVLTAVAFYKDLKNPFVSATFNGADVALTGQQVFDPATGQGFTTVNAVGNAGSGELYGVELGLNHFFRWAPKPLDGLFVSANATLAGGSIRSEFIRNNEALPLPSQPRRSANISVGYEDETFTLRWSGNYVGGSLRTVDAGNPELDTLRKEFWSMDVNLRVNVTNWLQLYADGINLNRASETRFYRGDVNGPLYERNDDFGRTYQVGVTTRFDF